MNHPFLERDIPMLNGDHVTTDAGTGLVHTAPAHGLEDYAVCNKYGIELYNPVNAEGKYISETPRVAGHERLGSKSRYPAMAGRNRQPLGKQQNRTQLRPLLASQNAVDLPCDRPMVCRYG